jgi:hypothetical protein
MVVFLDVNITVNIYGEATFEDCCKQQRNKGWVVAVGGT